MYIIWFDCCGLAVSAITLLSYYTRNRIPIRQNRVFLCQVWCVLITTICNLLMGILQNRARPGIGPEHILLMNVLAFTFHTFRMMNGFFYMYYIIVVLNIVEKSWLQFCYLYVPTIVAICICFVGPIWKLVYSIDSNGIHHSGPLMPFLYCIALYYMFLIIFLTIYYRRVIPLPRRIAFHSFSTLVMGTVIVERLFPMIMIECFGSVLCQLLIYLTLQKPEEVMDGSTGLLNKISLLRMLSIRFRQKVPFDLLVIQLDNYHFMQKSLGIRAISSLMTQTGIYLQSVAPRGTIFRAADQTFCIMLNSKRQMAEPLMEKLQGRYLQSWNAGELHIPMSAYLQLYHCPEDAESVEDVLDLLEMTMLEGAEGKKADSGTLSARQVREVENILQSALKNGKFQVYYQPIYAVQEGAFHSAEALIRVYDERLCDMGPEEFIPIAEKSGLIIEIGRFVLDEVCRFISEHDLESMGLQYIEVNLSIVECLQENIVEQILETLDKYGVDAKMINLEVTETASDTLPATVMEHINKLAEKGISFSLDDYGTGYSNISRILTMPLEIIKLDKTIVQAYFLMDTAEADIVMVETMTMLKKLKKSVVAEGVETKDQAERLIQMGCEFLQGYYYAKPMPAGAFLEYLRTAVTL